MYSTLLVLCFGAIFITTTNGQASVESGPSIIGPTVGVYSPLKKYNYFYGDDTAQVGPNEDTKLMLPDELSNDLFATQNQDANNAFDALRDSGSDTDLESAKNLDASKLAELLAWVVVAKQQQQQQQQQSQESQNYRDAIDQTYVMSGSPIMLDINAHLPPDNPLGGETISGPVNDPAEFEAAIGQLADSLNHKLPNSQNRSQILENVLSSAYLNAANKAPNYTYKLRDKINDLHRAFELQQQQQQQDSVANNIVGQTDENETPASVRSAPGSVFGVDQSEPVVVVVGGSSGRGGNNNVRPDDETNGEPQIADTTSGASRYGGSEYIDHPLALAGHQYVQGGAGEGRQLLGPEGTFENVQVIKSDYAVPSYCDPPNPCPIGYTAQDGCLENFVNSASFSREYQAKQQCSCDNEHSLFNCAAPVSTLRYQLVDMSSNSAGDIASSEVASAIDTADGASSTSQQNEQQPEETTERVASDKIDTLARAIQNRFGDLASLKKLISKHENEIKDSGKFVRSSRLDLATRESDLD